MIYCMQLFTLHITAPVTIKTVNHSRSIWRTCALLAIHARDLLQYNFFIIWSLTQKCLIFVFAHSTIFKTWSWKWIFRTLKTPCILLHHQYSCVNYFYPESSGLWPAGNPCTDPPPLPLGKNRRMCPFSDFCCGEVGLYTGYQLGATYWSRETLGDSIKKIFLLVAWKMLLLYQ